MIIDVQEIEGMFEKEYIKKNTINDLHLVSNENLRTLMFEFSSHHTWHAKQKMPV